jgi:hypothetical protein
VAMGVRGCGARYFFGQQIGPTQQQSPLPFHLLYVASAVPYYKTPWGWLGPGGDR